MKTESHIARWQTAEEGQFFDRKSAFDRSGARPKPRKAADLAWDVVETLSAMANADGGELVVGLEDAGELTGVPHAEDKLRLMLGAPKDRNYVSPPLPCRGEVVAASGGLRLLHFEVDWSPQVHVLADSRCLLRVRDRNEPFAQNKIQALKETKGQNLFERTFPPGARFEDLDGGLAEAFAAKAGAEEPPVEILARLGLVEKRNGHAIPTLAALLLFGREPGRWHERCGIDFVRWEGTTRKSGAELNLAKRIPLDGPLARLPEQAFAAIKPFIRERQQLHDLFFIEKLEYPTFAWQEAIINAVAHRDYSIRGVGIEVWMFDDRLEIRSPGLPPAPVTLEALAQRQHLHCSRNPLMVRALTILGYMRELGEGIPRMFEEMERAGCYPPRFEAIGGAMTQVTLRNEPVYDRATLAWLDQFKGVELSGDQKRILAYAHAHGDRFTSREYQTVLKTDIYGASAAIKDLIRKGVARSTGKGSRVYTVHEPLAAKPEMPVELGALLPVLQRKTAITNADLRRALGLTKITAARLLKEWVAGQWLVGTGKRGVGAKYSPGPRLLSHSQTSNNGPETETMRPEPGAMKP